MQGAYLENDTIAALATPIGVGALAIIRISGHNSVPILSSFLKFSNGSSLETVPAQKAALAYFQVEKTILDQVMVTFFRAPHSYTGENLIELTCHGSLAALREILNVLSKNGARLAEPGEFTQRAFLNNKMDLTQAEAVADLIHSQTELSQRLALAHLQASFSKEISKIRNKLLELLAQIEVGLDHSDDPTAGVLFSLQEIKIILEEESKKIKRLADSFKFGRLLREGVHISIVGKPNVGKSSLLNCLLKSERSIVTHIPGTTRDTIEEGFDLFGMAALLVDTAGIRQGVVDPVEQIGIERTLKSLEKSDAVIVVCDGSEKFSLEDKKIWELVKNKEKVILAINKNDLETKINKEEINNFFPKLSFIFISSLKNQGIENLMQELASQLLPKGEIKEEICSGMAVSSLRQKNALCQAHENLNRASALCRESSMEECLAMELKGALDALGMIVGEVVTEDLLKEIFSKFCIGK